MKSPQGRLHDLATEALAREPENFQVAVGLFLEGLLQDAGAINALIGGDKVRTRAGEYLREVWAEKSGDKGVKVKTHKRSNPGGQRATEAHRAYAARNGGDHIASDSQIISVPAAVSPARRAAAIAVRAGIFARQIGSGTRTVGDVTRFDVLQIKRRGMIDSAVADGLLSLNWPDDYKTTLAQFASETDVEAVFHRAHAAFDALGLSSYANA